jgi:hypothetical protein
MTLNPGNNTWATSVNSRMTPSPGSHSRDPVCRKAAFADAVLDIIGVDSVSVPAVASLPCSAALAAVVSVP